MIRIQQVEDKINSRFKTEEIARLNIGVHFEDSPSHAEEIVRLTTAIVVLVPQPWNRKFQTDSERIIRPDLYTEKPAALRAFYNFVAHIS